MEYSFISIAAKVAQLPLVFFIALLCYMAKKVLRIKELLWISVSFSINVIYLLFSIASDYYYPGNKYNIWSNIAVFLGALSSFFLLLGIVNWVFDKARTDSLSLFVSRYTTKRYLRIGNLVLFLLVALALSSRIKDMESPGVKILNALYGIASLLALLYIFYYEAKQNNYRIRALIWGIVIWTVLQILVILPDDLFKPEVVSMIGFGFSLIAKMLFLFTLFSWYVDFAVDTERKIKLARQQKEIVQEQKDESDKLTNFFRDTLASFFHELLIPINSLGSTLESLDRKIAREGRFKFAEVETHYEQIRVIYEVWRSIYYIHDPSISNKKINYLPLTQKIKSVNVLIGTSIKSISDLFGHVVIETQYGPKCFIKCNSVEIIQVFTNLFKNAVEAYPESESKSIFVKSRLDRSKMNVVVEIEDHAGGIPIEIIDEIWVTGFSTKEVTEANIVRGQGLAIVRQLLDKNDATVEVVSPIPRGESNIKGTRFTIYFSNIELDQEKR